MVIVMKLHFVLVSGKGFIFTWTFLRVDFKLGFCANTTTLYTFQFDSFFAAKRYKIGFIDRHETICNMYKCV